MNLIHKKLPLFLTASFISACASTTIDNAVDFQTNPAYKKELLKAQIMPTDEQMAGKPLSVIVLPTETKNSLAKKSEASGTLRDITESLLKGTGAEIIDRSMASKVKDELVAYESTGKFNATAVNVADIAVAPVISAAKFSQHFNEGHYAKDVISGKKIWVEPSCTFKVKVSGYLKSYELPTLKSREQLELKGNSSTSRDTRSSNCNLSTVERHSLTVQAVENTIRNYRTELQNQFAPTAYVIAYRVVGDDHYVKINGGANKKIKEGTDIEFVQLVAIKDDFTGEVSNDKFKVGSGSVTNIIQEKSSWVNVDAEVANKLKLGDIAVVKYKMSFLEGMRSVSQSVGNL